MQINNEYTAKFNELNSYITLYENIDATSLEQMNAKQGMIDAMQIAIDYFDLKVHEWENLNKEDVIDHQSGFVTEMED